MDDNVRIVGSMAMPWISAGLITTAVVWLFFGWRLYWLFVTLLTAAAASVVGWFFIAPQVPDGSRYLPPLLLGLAGGAVAIPLQRVVAFAAAGFLGALIAVAVSVGFCNVSLDFSSPQLVAIAAAGFLVAGVPSAIFLKFLTVFITSGYGALLGILGAVALGVVFMEDVPTLGVTTIIILLTTWTILTTTGIIVQFKSLVTHRAQQAQ